MDKKQPIIAILTDRYFPYQAELVESITAELGDAGYAVLCVTGRELQASDTVAQVHSVCNAIYKHVHEMNVSGIIALSGTLGHGVSMETISDFLHQFSVPMVSLGMDVPNINSVYLNEGRGMSDLMEHLISDGIRKHFAFIRGHKNDPYSQAREAIFRNSLESHGHKLDECYFVEGDYNPFTTYRETTQLLNDQPNIDCIVAANDVMAASAARAAKAQGLSIPLDIAISGFDDTSDATRHSPAITTVRQPVAKMAQDSVKLILAAIEKQTSNEPYQAQSICSPTELIARRSTGSKQTELTTQGTLDEPTLRSLLKNAMHGLDMPESIVMQDISMPLWKTMDRGSVDLITLAQNLSDSILAQNSHWVINLIDHIYSISDHLLQGQHRDRRMALITSAISKVRERIWAMEMDQQFEASRQQNVRSDMLLEMTSCTDIEDILNAMNEWLTKLNPKRCFLVCYETTSQLPDARAELIHVFREGQSEYVLADAFESKHIVPEKYQDELQQGLLILSPLYADDILFGYLLIDPTGMDLLYIEAAAQAIGNAMRTHYHIGVLETQKQTLESVNHELGTLANFDALTGLANRLQFQQYLENCCKETLASDSVPPFALLFIDLDGFKLINDTLGHSVGDRLLNKVAQRLVNRISNTSEYDGFIARLGGDEFTIVLHPTSVTSNIHAIANGLLSDMSSSYNLDDNDVAISASIGAAFFPNDAKDSQTLVKRADFAMYRAKDNGKNNIVFFSPDMISADNQELQLAQELRFALEHAQLQMHYQPRVDLNTGKICAVEALMRWIVPTPEGGAVRAYPDEFIALAEKIGIISQLDTYALDYSCKQAAAWAKAGIPIPVSVNVSVKQLQQPQFIKTVTTTLATHDLDPRYLELEITETAAMTHVEHNIQKLTRLKNMGIKVSIDDFGTGYSSLNYLKRLPVDNLKIDRSFIMDIEAADGGTSADASIVRSVVALGKGMGFRLIAEGVETPEQAEFVRSLHCDEVQGYLYSKPVREAELTELLQSDNPYFTVDKNQQRAA